MWDDVAALGKTANMLFAAAAMLMLYGIVHYVVHLPIFPLRDIRLTGDVSHVTREQVDAVVAPIERLEGDEPRGWLQAHGVQHAAERHASPLADRRPALLAGVFRDLRPRWQRLQLLQRP